MKEKLLKTPQKVDNRLTILQSDSGKIQVYQAQGQRNQREALKLRDMNITKQFFELHDFWKMNCFC